MLCMPSQAIGEATGRLLPLRIVLGTGDDLRGATATHHGYFVSVKQNAPCTTRHFGDRSGFLLYPSGLPL